MTKKKESKPVISLPDNFRLTTETRQKLTLVALKDKFGKRTEELFDQEIEFLNCINEYLYPLEKRKLLQQYTTVFDDRYTPFIHINAMEIDDQTIGPRSSSYSTKLGKSVLHFTGLLQSVSYMQWNDGYDEYKIIVPKSEFRYTDSAIRKLLPKAYYDKLFAFVLKCQTFVKKRELVRQSLEALLLQYTSAKKLCEDYPEFIDWIYQYAELPPQCTDMGSHDLMQEIRNTCATV